MSALSKTLEDIDTLHSQDPKKTHGKANELIYAERMSTWLEQLESSPSEALQIAVRSQHLCRWLTPRSDYPTGRTGYLQWRSSLGKMHAEKAVSTMAANGYNEDSQKTVFSLVRKLNIKRNPEAQTLEDCACLVFLEYEFAAFAAKHSEEKIISIVQKTWAKMSPKAQKKALDLSFTEQEKILLGKALK